MFSWLDKYFTFSANERKAVIALIILAPLIWSVPYAYRWLYPAPSVFSDSSSMANVHAFIAEYEEREKAERWREDTATSDAYFNPYAANNFGYTEKQKKPPCFAFDPNIITDIEWVKLGFSEKQAQSIEKFKMKGGRFYKPEDLQKVHVISPEMYEHILPCVQIKKINDMRDTFRRHAHTGNTLREFIIDINTADSSLFERQKGIGPALASRIVRYRNRLGGFVSVEQIREVWGMPDSTYQFLKEKMTVGNTEVLAININTADIETMRKHPYLNYSLAKVIYNYREQHGNFKSKDELLNITIITDSIYQKLSPYICTQ